MHMSMLDFILVSVVMVVSSTNVLVVYDNDQYNKTGELAASIADGAAGAGATVRLLDVQGANYDRDVKWADAIILGSGVYNGNAAPALLAFLNSFDFMDDLSSKVR